MTEISAWTYVPSLEADRILETVLTEKGEKVEYEMDPPTKVEPGTDIFHISCHTASIPHIPYLAQQILNKLPITYISLGGPENCCGSPQWSQGDDFRARQVANLSLGAFRRVQPNRVVSTCPDCDVIFELYKGKQHNFSHSNLLDLLAENIESLSKFMVHSVNRRVIIHSHTGNKNRDRDALNLEKIMTQIPGVEIIKSEHAGGLGNHCLVKTGRYKSTIVEPIVQAMFDEAIALSADTLVVPYHGCYRQHLKNQLKYPVEILHYVSILAEAMNIPYHDNFKKIRFVNDIDEAIKQLDGRAKESGISIEKLRGALEKKVFA